MKTFILSLALVGAHPGVIAGSESVENYVAHEWGTFTSVQGADGALLEWNPLETTKLPKFVYDWNKPGLNRRPTGALSRDTKSVFLTLQRMETPVIYFYSDQERKVDVSVQFPRGLITEWYPQAQEVGPSAFLPNPFATSLDHLVRGAGLPARISFASMFGQKGIADSRIHWEDVRVAPMKAHGAAAGAFPVETGDNHYFAARGTDASNLEIAAPGAVEHEKFLFYRGVANFKTPLEVTVNSYSESNFALRNHGKDEIRDLFVLAVRRGQGRFAYQAGIPAGQRVNIQFDDDHKPAPLNEVVTRISEAMKKALTEEGLYEREAAAMVKTWRESWFEEDGLRVFYVLPRAWTDETLPLTLEPKPRETVRVMVGRAEIIPPSTQWELLKQIVRYSGGDSETRQQAVAAVKESGLGRFLQPAVQKALGAHASREFSRAAWDLFNATTRSPNGKSLAAK
jgi:hypothetical protein